MSDVSLTQSELMAQFKFLSYEQRGDRLIQLLKEDLPLALVHNKRLIGEGKTTSTVTIPSQQFHYTLVDAEQLDNKHHQHNSFILMIILSGTISHRVGSHTFRYSKGHCCFLSRNVDHIEIYSDNTEVVFLFVKMELLQNLINVRPIFPNQEAPILKPVTDFIHECSGGQVDLAMEKIYHDFTPNDEDSSAKQLRQLIIALESLISQSESGSTFLIMHQLFKLVELLWDPAVFIHNKVQSASTQSESLFLKLQQIVESQNGRITRHQLESKLNYNGEYLNHLTKKFSGKNITQFCLGYLLDDFRKCLLSSNEDIDKYLERAEITNRTHFFKLFKARFGMTPNQYRKLNMTPEDDVNE